MNFLGHAYLSFGEPGILTGNLISDHVKGKKIYEYEQLVYKGIRLHRAIDNFTDSHTAVKKIRNFFSPSYGLYSAVFTDVALDYFIANDDSLFTEETLKQFTESCYQQLDEYIHVFPGSFKEIYPYMKQFDWLSNYRNESGILNSFRGLARRAKYMNDASEAFRIFIKNKTAMREHYDTFFPVLKMYAGKTLAELLMID